MDEEIRKSQSTPKESLYMSENYVVVEDLKDFELSVSERKERKNDKVLIELPKDIINKPEVCAMMDRTATLYPLIIVHSLKVGK